MTYRRNSNAALIWKRWKQGQAELILACGVPEAIESENSWWDYLQHRTRLPEQSQRAALRQLVLSWPGRSDTLLGDVLGLWQHGTASV